MLKRERGGWDDPLARATRGLRRKRGSRQTVLLARRAPTMKRWSLDARSEEQSAYSPLGKLGNQQVLVRCAQLRAALATPLEGGIGKEKALARAEGTSRRASGWAGEKAARSWDHPSHPLKRDSSRRPCMGQDASQGEESVLADSGRVGEITARVGRVRTETILSNPKNNSPTRHPQVALIFKPLAT
jgi:hypothetical protein